MEKTVNVKIPNEIWVDDFSANKTATFNYSGPAKIWIIVEEDNTVNSYSETEPVLAMNRSAIEVDIAAASPDKLQAAVFLVMQGAEHTYTYTPETNHDGSTYQRITNPKLNDYYTLRYNPSSGFELKVIEKDRTVPTEKIAQDRKTYVEKYANAYEFSTEDQAKITSFLTAINAYLQSVETAYPWKYVQIDKNEVPKIPVSLVQLFNTLPALS